MANNFRWRRGLVFLTRVTTVRVVVRSVRPFFLGLARLRLRAVRPFLNR